MIKNIVFDIGNVIAYFDMNDAIANFTDDKEKQKFLYDNVYMSPEWKYYGLIDSGFLSYEDIAKIICDRTNFENAELVTDFCINHDIDNFKINYEVIELIKKLKSNGYHVYVLSNTNKEAIDYINKDNFLSVLDGYVLSFEVHMLKPHEGIYKELLNKYNLVPEETLFIDDLEENINTANKLNINGKAVNQNDYNSVIQTLKLYNVNVD